LAIFISDAASVSARRWRRQVHRARKGKRICWDASGKASSKIGDFPSGTFANSGCAFKPVPTAVRNRQIKEPMSATACGRRRGRAIYPAGKFLVHGERRGILQMVRPIFTMPANSAPWLPAHRQLFHAGKSLRAVSVAAAMCIPSETCRSTTATIYIVVRVNRFLAAQHAAAISSRD